MTNFLIQKACMGIRSSDALRKIVFIHGPVLYNMNHYNFHFDVVFGTNDYAKMIMSLWIGCYGDKDASSYLQQSR